MKKKKDKIALCEKVMIAIKNAIKKEIKVIDSDDGFAMSLEAAIVGCASFVAAVHIAVGVENPDKYVVRLFREAADQLEKRGGEE